MNRRNLFRFWARNLYLINCCIRQKNQNLSFVPQGSTRQQLINNKIGILRILVLTNVFFSFFFQNQNP
ncbi:MAG: hypothetical protein C0433_15300 [Cyclobacterium sp.]|nr:hypothetical protein [Cyclobacterium sp.]